MSCSEHSGRVNSIKNQFESLKGLNFLDENVPKKVLLKKPGIFKRSKTAHDMICKSEIVNPSFIAAKKYNTATKKDTIKSENETLLAKKKFTKLFDESRESKLSRQTSDPIKRSSIKRSPAFRISANCHNNTNISINTDTSNNTNAFTNKGKRSASIKKQEKVIIAEEINTRFEYFLVRKCSDINKLQQSSLTDSIRYALKQPLPTGPPPKKPPRTFIYTNYCGEAANSSPDEFYKKNQQQPNGNINRIEINKIQLLERALFSKKEKKKEVNCVKGKKPITLTKSNTEIVLHGSKFLDCISFRKSISTVYDSFSQNEYALSEHTRDDITTSNIIKRFSNIVTPIEPIYMEPFSHLNVDTNFDHKIETVSTSADSINDVCINENFCSCPELHHNFKEDLHYLCTAIDENVDNKLESSELGAKLTLGKTYNEITILVDAAFQNKTNTSNEHFENENSDGKLFAARLSRTLTEKRKDYVRKIAVLPANKIKNYGTLNETFKSPVVKTFSLDENDRNLFNNNSSQDSKIENNILNTLDDIIPITDRLKNYKKLVQENLDNTDSKIKLQLKTPVVLKNIENEKPEDFKICNQHEGFLNKIITHNETIYNVDCSKDHDIYFNKGVDKAYEKACINEYSHNISENKTNEKLFEVFILVGYNLNEKTAYLKYKFPRHKQIPDNIEQLIFPSEKLIRSDKVNQEYCLILTDDNGFKIYGYCRRILAEDCDTCLPLCYCIISEAKALAFYQKLLKEIESRHGQNCIQINFMLRSLQKSELPKPGKYLHIKLPLSTQRNTVFPTHYKIAPKHLSIETSPKWLTESIRNLSPKTEQKEKTFGKTNNGQKSLLEEYEQKKGYHSCDYGLFNESVIIRNPKFDEILIRRPNDLRLENTELSDLYVSLGPELLVIVFSTLLLERKVILESENVTKLSKSILALQTILYPFQWQYTIVTILPDHLTEICQAPFPILVGTLESISFEIEDGIIINLDNKCIKQNCGDEQTILPDTLQESLHMSLEMVDLIDQGKSLSSVLISEAFLRFFVELFGNYKQKYFHKEEFIQCHTSENVKFFLEWFVETSMFRYFCKDKFDSRDENYIHADCSNGSIRYNEIITEKKFYELFEARLIEKSENKSKTKQNIESIVKNSKIINKKAKSFKERLKLLMGQHSHN